MLVNPAAWRLTPELPTPRSHSVNQENTSPSSHDVVILEVLVSEARSRRMARDHKIWTYRVRHLPPHIDEAGVIQLLQQNFQTETGSPTVCVHSLVRSLTVLDARRSKTATITIVPLPDTLEGNGEWSFETQYGGSEYHVMIDRNFLDFTVLNEVDDDAHTLE